MANNQLKQQKVEKNNPVVWIADWNGSNKGLGTVKNEYLSAAVIRQLGLSTANLFLDNFINYKEGVILGMNQAGVLNKFFERRTGTTAAGIFVGIASSIVFKCVRMPGEFKDQKNILSSPYAYGEKLILGVTFEDPNSLVGNQTTQVPPQVPNGAAASVSNVTGGRRMITVYRDLNIQGRCLKGSGASTGNSIGVWS
jgi:hypothetical protein